MSDLKAQKDVLRKKFLDLRANMNPVEHLVLDGAIAARLLALPEFVERFTQPFISAYWAWSGSVNGGLESEVLKAVNSIVQP